MYPMETACATSMVAVQQSSGVPQQASGHSEMLAATTTPAACKPETSSLAAASALEPATERSHFGSKTCSRRVATADQRVHDSFEVVVSAYSYGMMRRSERRRCTSRAARLPPMRCSQPTKNYRAKFSNGRIFENVLLTCY